MRKRNEFARETAPKPEEGNGGEEGGDEGGESGGDESSD